MGFCLSIRRRPTSGALVAVVQTCALPISTGALGGASLTTVKRGEQAVLRFKADRPGTFIYHCAPEGMVAWHVVAGMSGTLMVLPRDGLKDAEGKPLHYDKAYTIGEFDLYIPKDEEGNYKEYETALESYGDTVDRKSTRLNSSH